MPADVKGPAGLAGLWLAAAEWRAHPARAVTAALAIAVGVALGFAVHLINGSALSEFDRAIRTVNGGADLQVQAVSPHGFDERLYPRLARAAGVAAASPVVQLTAVAGRDRSVALTVLGLDILRAAEATPSLVGRRAEGAAQPAGADAFDENALFLSPSALEALHARAGATVEITTAGRTATFTVAGLLPAAGEGQMLGVIDIAAAQWRFGRLGRLDRVDLRLAEGAAGEAAPGAIARLLPADAQLASAKAAARRSDALSRAYRVNLDMLALVALLTGGFLVYSAQSLSAARRRPQFALLRVLGLERRALITQVTGEGLLVGAAGAAAGLLLGLGVAATALRILGGDLGGGYFDGARPGLIFSPAAGGVFLGLGLAAALLGSLLPAREAARTQAAAALKNLGDPAAGRGPPQGRAALALLAAGAAVAFLPAVVGLPLFGYISIALLLAGGVAATPWLARLLLSPLQGLPVRSPAAHLALRRLWDAPGQAALALCGVVASASLGVAMAVMVWSFRGSVDAWLGQVLSSDVFMRIDAPGEAAGFGPQVQQRLAATPGVARIDFVKSIPLQLSADRPPVVLVVRPRPGRSLPLIGAGRAPPRGETPVWVSEPAAWIYGYRTGQALRLPLGGGTPVVVAGAWRDYARQHGAIAMDEADYLRLTGDSLRSEASIDLTPDADVAAVTAALRAALPEDLAARATFARPAELRAAALRVFDRSFAITYLLEAVAILVGLAGVAATFSAQTLARTKEFGMLRHVGATRGDIIAMLGLEGLLLGAVGVVAGLALGLAMSQVLIHVVNPQSFHWTMQTRLPFGLLAAVAAGLVGASAGAALIAGRRALSAEAVRAVREDW